MNPSWEDQYSMGNMSLSYRAKHQKNMKCLGVSKPAHKANFNAALPMPRRPKEQLDLHNVKRLKLFMGFQRPEETKWNGVKKADLKLERPWFPLKQQHLSEKSCIFI